jgi:non-ribosomal peptide synthetase component E (peptide arylation enzyme)
MIELLQDAVTRQAERRPDAVELVMGDERLTYCELEA